MSINWQPPKFKAGDKVVICDWNEVIKAIDDDEEANWRSIRRRLECARLYGGKSAIVVDWGPDVYSKEGQTYIVNIYRLADESGAIIPFAFMDCMLTRLEPNDTKEVTKSASDAAEEKVEGRPQILKGDIMRFISGITGEEAVHVVTCENPEIYFNSAFGEVLAIYRFDGRDFKCVWESREYMPQKWNKALANAAEAARRVGVSLEAATAALEKLAKVARDKAGKASE